MRHHPLATVLFAALLLRLPAVIFSGGFMASDDHFSTVRIAYFWLVDGMFASDGYLTWDGGTRSDLISRFPLYNLFLAGQMAVGKWLGLNSLNEIMYLVRAVHVLLSLVSVWAAYEIVRVATGRVRWAVIAGLVVAGHFLMPFLAARNLIEMVGGHIFLAGLAVLYLYGDNRKTSLLIWAGLLCGLSWTIRFQLAFAILPIPFVLAWYYPRWRAAGIFTGAVAAVIIASGFADLWLLGGFASSTVDYIRQSLDEHSSWDTNPFMYIILLLTVPLPIASLIISPMMLLPRFIREHALLVAPVILFVIGHTLAANRQERFLLPVLGLLLVIGVLIIYREIQTWRFFDRHRRLFNSLIAASAAVSLMLLPLFWFHYPHKGMVEPFVRLNGHHDHYTVLFMTPDFPRFFPLYYAGESLPGRVYVHNWSDWARLPETTHLPDIDYLFLYPSSHANLPVYLDSVKTYFPHATEMFHVSASPVTHLLHLMNPDHNPTDEMWVYRVGGDTTPGYSASQSQVMNSP